MPTQLSTESRGRITRLIAAGQSMAELETQPFLEDHPGKALELVLTLKHYANPLANYPVDREADEALETTKICLADPTKLQPNARLYLTQDETNYLIELQQLRLDRIANEIMAEKNISPAMIEAAILARPATTVRLDSEPPKSVQQQWWDNLTKEQQRQVQQQHNELNSAQQTHLNQRMYYANRANYYVEDDVSRYYQMSFIQAELNYLKLRVMFDLTSLGIRALAFGAMHALKVGAAVGSSLSFPTVKKKEDVQALGIVAAIIALVTLAISAVIGSVYALKKAYNSFRNIFFGDKIARSIYRLAGTAGGVYLGMLGGAALGAVLGSVIPGLGTAVGVILGTVFGAGVGAGLGSFGAKWSAKLISKLTNKNELNPTNPSKWKLSSRQMDKLYAKGIVNIPLVNADMKQIKEEKDKIGWKGSFFWTKERKAKDELNSRLRKVKKGEGFFAVYPPRYEMYVPPRPSAPVMMI